MVLGPRIGSWILLAATVIGLAGLPRRAAGTSGCLPQR
jgi:hypothetical protein